MSESIVGLIKVAPTKGEPLFKGDVAGREFHGNQYISGGAKETTSASGKAWNGKEPLQAGHIVHLEGDGVQKYKVLEARDARGDMPRVLVEAQDTGMKLAPTERVAREHIRAPSK